LFIVIPRLGGISVGFAGMMDYWKTGMMGFWVFVFVVLALSDFRSLTGGALMLRVMCLIFLFVSCVPGSGCPASD
jgi:hypothetical protein